ncbi:MAG TPA: glycolate oxidase subunit GlcE [Casimicrobiaceae bacterium]|nr:glycolate oxidase subunit GlcE [Casimicrobiaceae bacterium]
MTDPTLARWQERVRTAMRAKTALRIHGAGSKDFYGEAPRGEPFDTRDYAGIVDYEPTELVITARAGTALDEIEATMCAHGQLLAFEPPHFAPGATLGGAVAAGLSGPRRAHAGAVRDFVLGVRMIDGRGDDLSFGGRVMKNVAGFDVARLMCGALGTLGILAEISLKCLPAARAEVTRAFDMSVDEAMRRVNEWGTQPLPVSASCYVDGRLCVRLSGARAAVDAAAAKLGGDSVDDGEQWWRSIRDHGHAYFRRAAIDGMSLWRLSVKSTSPHADLSGEQMIEWGGALRWLAIEGRSDATKLRNWAASHGGHATLFRAADKAAGVFQPLPPPLARIHQRLKAAFDPYGILNPGRMYASH